MPYCFRYETFDKARNIVMRSRAGESLQQAHDRLRKLLPGARVFCVQDEAENCEKRRDEMRVK